jgi:hypothetical protein
MLKYFLNFEYTLMFYNEKDLLNLHLFNTAIYIL